MKTVRLDAELEARLREAACAAGITESQLIREAIRARCDEILGNTLAVRLAPYIGIVHSGEGHADRAHQRFGELLAEEHDRQQREARPRS